VFDRGKNCCQVQFHGGLPKTCVIACKLNKIITITPLETLDTRTLCHLQESARFGTLCPKLGRNRHGPSLIVRAF
jgi:hypothetical protein